LNTITTDGVWTWHQNPRAVYENGKTFTGYVNQNGDIVAASISHSDGSVTETTLKAALEADDHASPGLTIDGSGNVWYFYSAHNGSTIYYRQSTNSHDISAFDSEQSVSPATDHTYCNPRVNGSDLYCFYQNQSNHWAYIKSNDSGSTWSAETEFITHSSNGVYLQMDDQDTSRTDFAAYLTGGTPSRRDIYHGYFDMADDTVYDSAGVSQGSSAGVSNLTQIYDTSASGNHKVQGWDCTRIDGVPQIVFSEHPDEDSDTVYRYASRQGGSWSHHRAISGGTQIVRTEYKWNYVGGVHLDRGDYGTLYASVGDRDSSKVVRMKTDDGGETWYSQDYSGTARQNVRPVSPANRDAAYPVVWLAGRYNNFAGGRYETSVVTGRETADGGHSKPAPGGHMHAQLDSDKTIPSGSTVNPLSWDSAVRDYREEFDDANDQFVADQYGLYRADVTLTFHSQTGVSAGDFRIVALLQTDTVGRRTDTDEKHLYVEDDGSGTGTMGSVTLRLCHTMPLDEGEIVNVVIRQESGTDLDLSSELSDTKMVVTQLR
jgi:hypothetical protein